jgi:hypothetical protein
MLVCYLKMQDDFFLNSNMIVDIDQFILVQIHILSAKSHCEVQNV